MGSGVRLEALPETAMGTFTLVWSRDLGAPPERPLPGVLLNWSA
jgi:hypothetical protein